MTILMFPLQEKMLDTSLMPWAILFQEFHTPVHVGYFDILQVSLYLKNIWVICSFLLVTAYSGNLKAAFVIKTFEDSPESVDEIADK